MKKYIVIFILLVCVVFSYAKLRSDLFEKEAKKFISTYEKMLKGFEKQVDQKLIFADEKLKNHKEKKENMDKFLELMKKSDENNALKVVAYSKILDRERAIIQLIQGIASDKKNHAEFDPDFDVAEYDKMIEKIKPLYNDIQTLKQKAK